MRFSHCAREKGATTVEFALLFPVVMLVTFFATIVLFRYIDAMMLTYQTNRVARVQSIYGTVPLALEEEIQTLPLLNQFQDRSFTIVQNSPTQAEAIIQVQDGLIPRYLIELTLSDRVQDSSEEINTVSERAIYVYRLEEVDE
ncbi:MAG TPA: pilus assembly protein [Caldisericia bacterium]|nr:pilus assembly protein [Caldisericia bacterium]